MQEKPGIIIVAGGIGCGKSVVCHILEALGYAVYDCDSRAKAIMDCNREIIDRIASDICKDAIVYDGDRAVIDRKRLAEEVFGDLLKLKRLNALVHGAVKQDILRWRGSVAAGGYRHDVVFVETALLKQSGLAAIADGVWEVTAPIETRVLRAMKRDNSDRAGIEARIRSQEQTGRDAECRERSALEDAAVKIIDNDGVKPVLPQVLGLLGIG